MIHVNQVRVHDNEKRESTHMDEENQQVYRQICVDSWEERLSEWTVEDIQPEVVADYRRRLSRSGRWPFAPSASGMRSVPGARRASDVQRTSDAQLLKQLFLVRGNRLKNAGAVLFCQTGYGELQLAVFSRRNRFGDCGSDMGTGRPDSSGSDMGTGRVDSCGSDMGTGQPDSSGSDLGTGQSGSCGVKQERDAEGLLDERRYCGTLFELMAAAERYVREHGTAWSAPQDSDPQQQVKLFPVLLDGEQRTQFQWVLHEALLNAFQHGDFNTGQCVEVLIYDDRLEIYNPGGFPENYQPEDFIKDGQRPVRKNRLIERAMYAAGEGSGLGLGLRRMRRICAELGIRLSFRKDKGGIVTCLSFETESAAGYKAEAEPSREAEPELKQEAGSKEQRVIAYLEQHGSITNASAREILHVGTTAARNLLNRMVDRGILTAAGEHRGRRYSLRD